MSFTFLPDKVLFTILILYFTFYTAYLFRIFILARKTKSRFNPVLYKFFLRTAYLMLIVISLMGPVFGVAKEEIPVSEKEIFIAVDLSKSMNADDIQPTRFVKAKEEIKKLIAGIKQTRIGIIIFTSEAYLHSPLTTDKEALINFTDILNTNLIEAQGTDFSEPVNLALEKFTYKGKQASQAIILVSDGEDFSSETMAAVEKASGEKVKIYSLGIGTMSGTLIQDDVLSTLNPESLINISEKTAGQFFLINDEKEETDLLVRDVNNWQGETISIKKADVSSNKYFYFLFAALILMIADVLITVNVLKI